MYGLWRTRASRGLRIRVGSYFAQIVVISVTVACGGESPYNNPAAPTTGTTTITGITISASILDLDVGGTVTLTATATHSDGTSALLSDADWSSSNATVASVDTQGSVTAHAEGTTTIAASKEGHSGSATINVIPAVAVDRLVVTAEQKTLRVGATTTVTLTAHYSDGSQQQVTPTWSSRNTAVATVTEWGLVTAVASGDAVIWGTYQGRNPSTRITVVSLENLVVIAEKKTLRVGQTTTVTLEARYSDGSKEQVTPTWSSRNTAVATVTAAGTVTAVAEGTAIIWGTYEGRNPSVTITVIPAVSMESVVIRLGDATLTVGATTQATAEARYSDGSREYVTATWASMKSSVATVSSSGMVTAVGTGTAAIRGRYEGMDGYRDVAVSVPSANIVWAEDPQSGRRVYVWSDGRYRGWAENNGSGCANNLAWRLETWELGGNTWETRGDKLDNVTGSRPQTVISGELFTYEGGDLYETGSYCTPDCSYWFRTTFSWNDISCSSGLRQQEIGTRRQSSDEGAAIQDPRPLVGHGVPGR